MGKPARGFHMALIAASGARRLNDFFAMLVDRYDRLSRDRRGGALAA